MEATQVKKMSDEELKGQLGILRGRLYQLRAQTVTEKVEDTSQLGKVRRDVARLLTEMNARRHAAARK
ncbi:MAG: 50S ribosomal protein L29 [Phycisphaerae bacterium]|nr:50S ribosomal protein L29 [Phycisphaerae bacterium]